MPLLLLTLIGETIFGNSYFKFEFGQINVLLITAVAAAVFYAYRLIAWLLDAGEGRRKIGDDYWLWSLVGYGVFVLLLSLIGFYEDLHLAEAVEFNSSYISRQAYYLFFLPLIALSKRGPSARKTIAFISSFRIQLFVVVYVMYLAWSKSFAINIPCCFCLGVLALAKCGRKTILDFMMLLLIVFSPIADGGELTQVIMRVAFVFFYIFSVDENALRYCAGAILAVIIGCFFIPVLPLDGFGVSANTLWRANYWGDELRQLWETFGMGVGYGTSYASGDFAGAAITGPFAETEEYSAVERLYVVGPHNSFISIAFRLGIIGIFLLLMYIVNIASKKIDVKTECALSSAFAVVASLIVVCFNVGFESPIYFFLFVFGAGYFGAVTHGESNGEARLKSKLRPWPMHQMN